MITDPLDHCGHTGVAHAKTFADSSAEECFAARRSVENHVARDDVVLGHELAFFWRRNNYTAAGKSFAEVIVCIAS